MKNVSKSILAVAALFALASIGQAAPNIVLPKHYDTVVKTQAEAEKLPAGSKIAPSCSDCKTLVEKKAEDKKGWLDWFKPESKHDCAGCKGVVTYRALPKTGGTVTHTHTCSKCGDNSAMTCAGHAKDVK